MFEGFGLRPQILIDDCNEIIDESYDSVKGEWGYVIIHTIKFDCGKEQQHIYPDIRRNLEVDLEIAIENEQYERAAQLRDFIKSLNNSYEQ